MVELPLIHLWDRKSLVFTLAWINIKIKHKGSYLGLLWTALEPLLLFVFLYTLFTSIRIASGEHFAIYLLTGITIYHAFARGTLSGLNSIKENRGIISSSNIRREFFPVVTTATASILLLVEMGVLFGLMPFFQYIPPLTVLLIPVVILFLLILILGMSYLLSIVVIYFRDIQPFWGVFVNVLFFITPIFWRLDQAEGFALAVHNINPVGLIVELAHNVVFGTIPSIDEWLYVFGIVMGILFLGFAILKKFEKNILEKM